MICGSTKPLLLRQETLLLGFVVVFGLAASFALWPGHGIADDAYITYRYAWNISNGYGFVYNIGERVQGTSTPLYTVILAAAGIFGFDIPLASWVINVLALVATVVITFLFLRRIHSQEAAYIAAILSSIALQPVAAMGMETPVYILLISGAFYALAKERYLLATVLGSGCALTRLDGLAVGVAVLGSIMLFQKKIPWKQIALYIFLIAPWFVFASIYFDGGILPASFLAKRAHTGYEFFSLWMIGVVVSSPYSAYAFVGLIRLFNNRLRYAILPIFSWSVLYVVAYSLSSIGPGYSWYQFPIKWALICFASIGACTLVHVIRNLIEGARLPTGSKFLASIVFIVLLAFPQVRELISWHTSVINPASIDSVRWRAASWLGQNLYKPRSIGMRGIGFVGWMLPDTYVVDLLGLVTPKIVVDCGLEVSWVECGLEKYKPDYVFDAWPPNASIGNNYKKLKSWSIGAAGNYTGWDFTLFKRIN